MTKGRIEAFSDGVITIIVLELSMPHGEDQATVARLWPIIPSYILFFVNIGICWKNHHHMFQAVKDVGSWVLWADLHLLFWLPLMPSTSGPMGQNHFAAIPMCQHALNPLVCALACGGQGLTLVAQLGGRSECAGALRTGRKKQHLTLIPVLAVPSALMSEVAILWVVADWWFAHKAGQT
jgi:uncharacterized membrane protein